MKILQMHLGLSLMGGVESMLIGLSNELARKYNVKVCTIFKPGPTDIYYTRLSSMVEKENLGIIKNGFSIRNLLKIFLYIRHSDADIIHIHSCFYYYALPILFFHKTKKFIYTFHSDAFMENQKWDKRIFWLKKFCLRSGWMHPVTISVPSQQSFHNLYGINSTLIENGVACSVIDFKGQVLSPYRFSNKTKIFIHPGRISEPKNQVVLCQVFQHLIKEGNDVVLLLAGSKQDESIFKKLKSYFSDRIVYVGERNDIPQMLYEADGMCLPSIWEGLPVVLLESLSVGCVPICSAVGGIPSVITNGENGFLSITSSAIDYLASMKTYLSLNEEELLSLKIKAKKTFEKFNIAQCVSKYVELYKDVLNN